MNKETEELKRLKTAADTWQLQRIADAMEEILRLVKKDMEPKKKKVEGDPQAMNAFGD